MFILRLVYTVYVIVTIVPGSSCNGCNSLTDDDVKYYSNRSVIIPPDSYCFVNECMIKITESDALFIVINNTGGWITATNMTNLFTTFVNGSTNNCSADTGANSYQHDIVLYIIQVTVASVGVILGISNVSLHLIFKEMLTASGILIIILCISISIGFITSILRNTIVYYLQVSIPTAICTVLFDYSTMITISIYEATKTMVLAHFVYSMYRSYKLLGAPENGRSLLCKYITFISVASFLYVATVITYDVMAIRNGFDGECVVIFNTSDSEDTIGFHAIYFVILLIYIFAQITLAVAGLILYFVTTKKCCATSTSKDFRVSISLAAMVGLSIILFCILLFTHSPAAITYLITSTATVLEQLILFVLFLSSNKVICCKSHS